MKWKSIKYWQKGAILLGGAHFLLVILILIMGILIPAPALGYYIVLIEFPWLILLHALGIQYPGIIKFIPVPDISMGTIFYAVVGAGLGYIIDLYLKGGQK